MSNWKTLVANIAPVLGTALGGPAAGVATKFIADKLLGKEQATEQEIAQFIGSASPEVLKELKQLDYEFQTKMAELGVDVYRLQVEDRKSARELAKVDMRPHIGLSAVFVVGYFILVYVIFSGQVDLAPDLKDTANILLGILTGSFPMILQFWFGSSEGSKKKDFMKG